MAAALFLLALTFFASTATSCATQEKVIVASIGPRRDELQGALRVAQDEVRVVVEGTDKVGTVEGAARFFLIDEGELAVLIKALRENEERKAQESP